MDPGHIVDFDGKRWLYMSDNICFPLTDDGLHFAGPGRRVLEDETFPDDWEIQGTYTEGPRLMKKDGWIYMTLFRWRYGRTPDQPCGLFLPIPQSGRSLGAFAVQPASLHPFTRGDLAEQRTRNAGRSSGRILVHAVPRIPEGTLTIRGARCSWNPWNGPKTAGSAFRPGARRTNRSPPRKAVRWCRTGTRPASRSPMTGFPASGCLADG